MRRPATIFLVSMGILLSFPQWAGAQWVQTSGPTGCDILALAVSGTNLFAGTEGDGVFLSTDNGASWTAASSGLPEDTEILCLAVNGPNLFAGTGSSVCRFPLSDIILKK